MTGETKWCRRVVEGGRGCGCRKEDAEFKARPDAGSRDYVVCEHEFCHLLTYLEKIPAPDTAASGEPTKTYPRLIIERCADHGYAAHADGIPTIAAFSSKRDLIDWLSRHVAGEG